MRKHLFNLHAIFARLSPQMNIYIHINSVKITVIRVENAYYGHDPRGMSLDNPVWNLPVESSDVPQFPTVRPIPSRFGKRCKFIKISNSISIYFFQDPEIPRWSEFSREALTNEPADFRNRSTLPCTHKQSILLFLIILPE